MCPSEDSDQPALNHSLIGSFTGRIPVSIQNESIAGRYRPVRVADGPKTARCRLTKNASWDFRQPKIQSVVVLTTKPLSGLRGCTVDLSPRWPHMSEDTFLTFRLVYFNSTRKLISLLFLWHHKAPGADPG